jgi:hypothetical protein
MFMHRLRGPIPVAGAAGTGHEAFVGTAAFIFLAVVFLILLAMTVTYLTGGRSLGRHFRKQGKPPGK